MATLGKRLCIGVLVLASILIPISTVTAQKFLKDLKSSDQNFKEGNFKKALSLLNRFKTKAAEELGVDNKYVPEYYIREARINLALGVLAGFNESLEKALSTSATLSGKSSEAYANALIDVASTYLEYGNFRLCRDYLVEATTLLESQSKLSENQKAKIGLLEAEALIGQGFCNDAVTLLKGFEKYFAARAVEKETYIEGGAIKTRRVPEGEISQRFEDFAQLMTLKGYAYGKRGSISIIGGHEEQADVAFPAVNDWLRKNMRYMEETSLADVKARYLYARIFADNFGQLDRRGLQFSNILGDLKKISLPTNSLGHELYLSYLEELLNDNNRSRYLNIRQEYQKVIDKNYPKNSMHRTNLRAVEFNSKLSRDRTKNIENEAHTELASPTLPKYHQTTARIHQFLFDIALAEKRYTQAENSLLQLIEIKKNLCGAYSPEYHLAKIRLANFYLDYTNKVEEAGTIYKESYLGLVAAQIGEQHKDLLDILNHLAVWQEMTDQYALAKQTLKQARDASVFKYDNADILYGIELVHIANLELKLGEYEQCEKDIVEALRVIDLKQNRDYVQYKPAMVRALETQARLYGVKGMFDEAENNILIAQKMADKSRLTELGNSSAEDLASLHIQLGKYSETLEALNVVITEKEKMYGPSSFRLIDPLVNKARIYLAKGDYTEAASIARRANAIAVNVYGERSTKTAPTQKMISEISLTLGDFETAQSLSLKAMSSQEKQFGRNHIEVAKSLSELAMIKFQQGDNKNDIEKLLLEARDIMASRLGTDNPQYADVLKNLSIVYLSEQKYNEAFQVLTLAEGIWKTKIGTKNNIKAAGIFTLTGDVYYQIKNYPKAESFYIQSQTLYEKFFNTTHPEYVKVRSKLAKVYYMQKRYKESKRLIEESLDNYERFIQLFFPALSEREKARYWNTIKSDFEFYYTLAFSNIEDFRDLAGKVYNYQLLTKSLLLSSSIKMRERILNSTDRTLKEQFNEWAQKKEQLTIALSMSNQQLAENGINPSSLQQEVEQLEKNLSSSSELFGQSFENKRITFEDVKKSIKANEVAIEILRYRHFDHTFTDSVIYAVLYLEEKFNRPKAIILGNGTQMENKFFKYYRNVITGRLQDQFSYNAFWAPIQKEIGEAKKVFISADGVYNQINLEAIPSPNGNYILDNLDIVLVNNTKDLYFKKVKSRPAAPENNAFLFGNPTFYSDSVTVHKFPALPGTAQETAQLGFLMDQKGWKTKNHTENNATEEAVKGMNSPKIFHVATHGFYRLASLSLPDLENNEQALANNPLMSTGLLLKGGGDLLSKTDFNYNMESGILTAYEAMSLNLDRTDLVVLSACETGLGQVEQGEGVYGLQRAFLVAGAKTLVMSMFKVDDDATQKLMLKFYQKWLNTGQIRNSFLEAKKELRVDFPDPIFWGAFMMIGLE